MDVVEVGIVEDIYGLVCVVCDFCVVGEVD